MKYDQTNPLPVPGSGAVESIPSSFDSTFDWEYALQREELLNLYEKGKARSWNASDLDWSTDVDLERMASEITAAGGHHVINTMLDPPETLLPENAVAMQLHMNAWMLSQFLHGEQGALVASAKLVMAAPLEEAKWYAANQVQDEARHVEVYHRYLTEKLGLSFEVNPHLQTLLDDIIADSRWDMTYLGMQIIVEGLALAAFGMMKAQMANEPLIQDITSRIMQDESRHVAFGVLSLESIYRGELSGAELREREDFIIEATHLMRDRLLMEQVYERMGWNTEVWVNWAKRTPFMLAFRQMLFSKIVPNLKRLGLLTPRVREEFGKLGLLQFEHLKDSAEDPEVVPPEELLNLIAAIESGSAENA